MIDAEREIDGRADAGADAGVPILLMDSRRVRPVVGIWLRLLWMTGERSWVSSESKPSRLGRDGGVADCWRVKTCLGGTIPVARFEAGAGAAIRLVGAGWDVACTFADVGALGAVGVDVTGGVEADGDGAVDCGAGGALEVEGEVPAAVHRGWFPRFEEIRNGGVGAGIPRLGFGTTADAARSGASGTWVDGDDDDARDSRTAGSP